MLNHIILNDDYPYYQPINRSADEAMAEVDILELHQQNDKDGVANVVHMKERNIHFRINRLILQYVSAWA